MNFIASAAALIIVQQYQAIAELQAELDAVVAILDQEKIPTERNRAPFDNLGMRPMTVADRVQYVVNQNSYNEEVASEILATRDEKKEYLETENKRLEHALKMAVMQRDDHAAAFSTVEAENKLLLELAKAFDAGDANAMEAAMIALKEKYQIPTQEKR